MQKRSGSLGRQFDEAESSNDPHHCRCYSIHTYDIEDFRRFLLKSGFKDVLQEDHGQLYGYALRVEEDLQLHIKIMRDGSIESEMEPPPAYPMAHLNQKHSYSAHKETEQFLRLSRVSYRTARMVPDTCRRPKIIKPNKPTHAAEFALAGVLSVAVAIALAKLLKDDKSDDSIRGV